MCLNVCKRGKAGLVRLVSLHPMHLPVYMQALLKTAAFFILSEVSGYGLAPLTVLIRFSAWNFTFFLFVLNPPSQLSPSIHVILEGGGGGGGKLNNLSPLPHASKK